MQSQDRYFIGIDPGTKCGWAIVDDHGVLVGSGVWDLQPRRHEGGGMRFVKLGAFFLTLLTRSSVCNHIAAVGYEEVRRHRGVDAAHVYGGIVATITQLCERMSIPYCGVPVATVKKLATGKGNARKGAMVESANMRWNIDASEDEADALWIAMALRDSIGGNIEDAA